MDISLGQGLGSRVKVWLMTGAVVTGALLAPLVAGADTGNVEGELEHSHEIGIKINSGDIGVGGLKLDIPVFEGIEGGDGIEITEGEEVYSGGYNGNFKVTDFRGTFEGWELQVSATEFVDGDQGISLGENILMIDTVEGITSSVGESFEPVGKQNDYTYIDDGSAVPVLVAAQGKGVGETEFGFGDDALSIVLGPSNARQGEFETTVKYELLQEVQGD